MRESPIRGLGRGIRPILVLGLVVVVAAVTACNPRRNLLLAGLPWVESEMSVTRVELRDGYLDATLQNGGGTTLRVFGPASPRCGRVLAAEATVTWTFEGAVGTASRDGERCVATGVGRLEEWRDMRPDPTGLRTTPVPREQATYRRVYADEEVIFLRGRFPLVRLLDWTGLDDTIAVVPNEPACQGPAERGVASLQYYPGGEPALALLSGDRLCPVEALLRPPGRELREPDSGVKSEGLEVAQHVDHLVGEARRVGSIVDPVIEAQGER